MDRLLSMIRAALADIDAWLALGILTLDDIDWDHPAALGYRTGVPAADLARDEIANKASHAIGFVCGVAAGMDLTPMSLVELVTAPPCVRSMGCVCAAHRRDYHAAACETEQPKRAARARKG